MTAALRAMSWRRAWWFGFLGSVVLTLCSHCVGATRARGGVMQWLGLSALTFGHAAGLLIAVMWLAIGSILISWIVVGGHILRRGRELTLGMVAGWTAPLILAGPLMSRDVYSYLMQGTLARDHINPYTHGAAANPGPLLFEVSADWRNTTTPYGPLHLWLGQAITTVVGDNVTLGVLAYKALSLGSFAALAWGVARLARQFGTKPSVAVWLGVANPLSILHLVGGMHNEVTMMALVVLGLYAGGRLRPLRGAAAGVALIAIGTALKATAVVGLPFLVWITVSRLAGNAPSGLFREHRNRLVALLGVGLGSTALLLAIVEAITLASGQSWQWLATVAGNTKVVNPLSLSSAVASTLQPPLSQFDDDITFNLILGYVRPATTAALGMGLVAAWWVFRRTPREALKGATLAYLLTCIFNAVVLPWYYAPLVALLAVWVSRRWMVFVTAWGSMAMCMMFDGGGDNRLYEPSWVLFILVVTWLMARACLGYRPGKPEAETDLWTPSLSLRAHRSPVAVPASAGANLSASLPSPQERN
ncbi:alpha-(1-_6)-mannopyranosyltransferase A [Corynebacterium heidelbergense]|nr:alpha-(1->6)-mannopyranosyltransferase A [Corynebacterium heidelbergense]